MKGETTRRAPLGPGPARSAPALSAVGALVRQHDPDRYRTALFAPAARREGVFALYAFNYEVARVRESVREPMLGQIRLQWWREIVEAAYAGERVRRHEVAMPFAATIQEFALSREPIDRLIEAREGDLAGEPPATLTALETYAEASSGGLLLLALEVLGVDDPNARAAAREVGIAYALCGLLRTMPFHAAAGYRYLPEEIAAASGLDLGDYARKHPSPALRESVRAIGDSAASHLAAGRALRGSVPYAALPALLPAVIAQRTLRRLRRAGWNPFEPGLAAPDPLLIWRLAAARLRRRF